MAKFHFFTDLDLMPNQTTLEFSPVEDYSASEFNLSSIHSLNISPNPHPTSTFSNMDKRPNAYAICSGTVFVYRANYDNSSGADGNIVALVLQPDEQPDNGLPKIKYFIYRGILLESLFEISSYDTIDDMSGPVMHPFSNDLTRRINESRKPSNTNPVLGTTLTKGFTLANYDPAKLIESIFYRGNGPDQLYPVKGGDCIGKFCAVNAPNSNSFNWIGMDIILDGVNYNPTLEIFRETSVRISRRVPIPSYSPAHLAKEIPLCFLDPCAFYGSLLASKDIIYARNFSDGFNPYQPNPALPGTPLYIEFTLDNTDPQKEGYTKILNKFKNKNKIYIDIRNPENNSLNYYNNYGNKIKLKINNPSDSNFNNLFETDYYREHDGNNTPRYRLYFLNASDFVGTNNVESTLCEVALPDGITANVNGKLLVNNENPGVYVPYQRRQQTQVDKWLEGATSFIDHFERNHNNGYTTEIKLQFPNAGGMSNKPVSNYVRINYFKRVPDVPLLVNSLACDQTQLYLEEIIPPDRTIRYYDHLDNVFTPFRMLIPQNEEASGAVPDPDPDTLTTNVYYDTIYVDNQRPGGAAFMANVGIAEDITGNITLFAFAADARTPAKERIDSSFAITGGSIGPQNQETFLQFIKRLYPKRINYEAKNLTINNGTIFCERIYEDTSTDIRPGPLGYPTPKCLAWVNITKADWFELQKINASTTSNPYTNTNGTYTADYVDTKRTFLGLKNCGTGEAPDQAGEPTTYVMYEFILRGEIWNGPSTVLEFKEIPTGIFYYSTNIQVAMPPQPAARYSTAGFTINQNGANDYSIQSTVYLVPGVDLTNEEFEICRKYFECNIRQVWNNNDQKNIINGNSFKNNGLSNSNLIDADLVNVLRGFKDNYDNLKANEIAFLLRKPSPTGGRSHVKPNRRQGEFFYKPRTGATYFVDEADNTAAHEFGHCLGLNDRYTYVSKVDNQNNIDPAFNSSTIPIYMQENSPAFDTEYIDNYLWRFNLYSTQKYVKLFGTTEYSSDQPSFLIGETQFSNLFSSAPYQPVIISGNTDTPRRCSEIYTQITSLQLDIVINSWDERGVSENGTDNFKKLFNSSQYVFFISQAGNNFLGTYIGFLFDEPSNPPVGKSDMGYIPTSTPDDKVMELRVNAPGNTVQGYFSPYINSDPQKRLDKDHDNDPQYMDNVIKGGLLRLQKLISDGLDLPVIQSEFPVYDSGTKTFDISGSNSKFYDFGDGDTNGRAIWNKVDGSSQTIDFPTGDTTVNKYKIKFDTFTNRKLIIQNLQGAV